MSILQKIVKKIYYESSSERLISFYRTKGVKIGERSVILHPRDIIIDYSRPELVEIGEHVFLHKGTRIFSHDWAGWCFLDLYNDFVPSHSKVEIGNNVWLGENVTILGGVHVGDNVIIGIGSIVTKDIPSNSVAVGVPARVICSIDDFYRKRKNRYISEILQYGVEILKSGREPMMEDFYDDYPAFVDGTNYKNYNYPYFRTFSKHQFEKWKQFYRSPFRGYEEFLNEIKQIAKK